MTETTDMRRIADDLMDKLELDDIGETKQNIQDNVAQAEDICRQSINVDVPLKVLEADNVFRRVVESMAHDFYFDEGYTDGASKGIQTLLQHLQVKYQNYKEGDENGK